MILEDFSDANWILNSDKIKATSCYAFTLGGSAIAWKFTKQNLISIFTIEVEFIAWDQTNSEVE